MRSIKIVMLIALQLGISNTLLSQSKEKDWRYIPNGTMIHSDGYVDQPYITTLDNGLWFCVYTTSAEHEGSKGQHIACRTSDDQGNSWSKAIRIEEPGMESASWGVPYVTGYGRIYVFYDYNGDKIHELGERKNIREDMLGWYCFKYSDNNGKSWSKRYRIPMRKTAVDHMNQWNGDVQIFWGIDKPKRVGNGCMFAFSKIGEYMLEYSDGWMYHCENIEIEKEAEKLRWKLLPDGEYGIRSPEWGDIQEEHNTVHMHNGNIYCIYRTTQGFLVISYSYDKGHSWSEPEPPVDYNGRALKNPRANPKIWKCENGRYLLWYHHNSTRGFYNRNPAWISGGIEKEGKIIWTQPEMLLYEKDLVRGPSYPDLIEQDGNYWITETQKTEARIHQIPNDFLNTLWSQVDRCEPSTRNLCIDLSGESLQHTDSVKLPNLLPVKSSDGFTLTVRLRSNLDMDNGKIIVDSRDNSGKGFWMQASENNSIMFSVSDGENTSSWRSDPGIIQTRSRMNQEVTVTLNYGPRIIQFITDGVVCDGKGSPFGWGRFNEAIEDISTDWLRIDKTRKTITGVKFYDRPLMNSEVIGDYRYWKQHLNK
ncbi:MAG: sialidase family protein [Bacteroidetes bacterium]|nr:sialidase family protein [Bacteroidota bacterium]